MSEFKREDPPTFQVTYMGTGHEYKIWADGHVEGFPPDCVVMNRIPARIAMEVAAARALNRLDWVLVALIVAIVVVMGRPIAGLLWWVFG